MNKPKQPPPPPENVELFKRQPFNWLGYLAGSVFAMIVGTGMAAFMLWLSYLIASFWQWVH